MNGIRHSELNVYQSGVESGNASITFDFPMKELVFISDDELDITLVVVGVGGAWSCEFIIKDGDVLDERFRPFSSITVTATGNWRYYVRSERRQ